MKNNSSKKRTLFFLVVNFVIVFTAYQIFLYFELFFGMYLYLFLAAGLSIAYFVINRGFGKPVTDPSDLPAAWSPVEKTIFIEEAAARHEKAKGILLWLLPVILTLMMDMTYLFLLQPILEMLGY